MMFQGEISNYSIQISSSTFAGPFGYTRFVAASGPFGIGFLNFIPSGRVVPPSGKRPGTSGPNVFDCFLPMDDYGAIVDLVRNEKPVFFFLDDQSLQFGVMTSAEPVGEEEGR
jgi:hypothetical protein